ncbi:MAG: hypothetical protein Sapg2KO_26840 [Saprospiraceae bacterium]
MRKQNLLHRYYFGLFLLGFLIPVLGYSFPDFLESDLETTAIFGCAGVNTDAAFCTFCAEADLEIDFLDVLNGNPRAGGTWTDLDNSNLDLSDPTVVDIAGLNTGTYRFQYNISAGAGCPADESVLTLNITGANTVACQDQVNAILQDDCTYLLTVENVLAGSTLCNDQLEVLVFDVETGFYGNLLGVDQVGKLLDVVVFEQGCPNPVCTSSIFLEDKGIPDLNTIDWLPDEIDLYCHDLEFFVNNPLTWTDPNYKYYLGGPIINDCSGIQVSVTDRIAYLDCGPVYAELHRTFIITDASGNIGSTTLKAEFKYPSPDQISKFEDIVINDCTPQDAIIPETYPFIINYFGDTIYLKEDGCNYSIGFEDREFIVCGGSLKIEREIRFFDWCEDRYFPIDTLVIKIGDFAAPVVTSQTDTAEVAVSPFQCTATLSINEADLERQLSIEIEDCNTGAISITGKIESYLINPNFVDSSFQKGSAINTGFYINNIPVGLHRLIMTLSDGCKSEGVDTVYFRVVDQTLPVMNCDDRILVSMSEGPYAQIAFSDIDEGSQDNCELSQLKIRRQVASEAYQFFDYNNNGVILGEELDQEGFTRFDDERTNGAYVEYYCSDLENPQQTVELWGWDRHGNASNCWSNILLEDKIPPACRAPKDTVVACYDFLVPKLDLLGTAELLGTNCGGTSIETLPTIEELNQCGAGTIVRRFQAIKNQGTDRELVGPICVQTVTIQNIQDYSICFPADVKVNCESDPNLPGPQIDQNDCALFAQYQEDIRLETVNDACYKILRTYEVINWCEYTPDDPAIIIGRDVDDDQKPGDEGICILVRPNGLVYLDQNNIETDVIPNLKGYWVNSQENEALKSTGFWKYTQHIKVVDETAPELVFADSLQFPSRTLDSEGNCYGVVEVPFSVIETCNSYLSFQLALDAFSRGGTPIPLEETHLSGTFPNYKISGDFPIGQHQFLVEANDGCGNIAKVEIPFEVIDDKGPAPICADVIVVNMSYLEAEGDLIPQASVDVQAFLQSPIFDCTGQGEGGLVSDFSINLQDSSVLRDQQFLSFDCSSIDEFVPVEVHAWDEEGNHDFCKTFVQVQDNQALCNEGQGMDGVIQGVIQTANGLMVENVSINLYGEGGEVIATNNDGSFSFSQLKEGQEYTVEPIKNDDFHNGVSTLDLIQIQQHILGFELLVNPYSIIAADINNSKSISAIDLIQLRKLILNIDDRFPNNTSWRFIEANYAFPDPSNPWLEVFPEVAIIEEIEALNDIGFIALKVGDVNASAQTNSSTGNTDPRSQETQYLKVDEIAMQRGAVYSVPIRIADIERMQGLQGTFLFDASVVQLQDIDYELINPQEVGLMLDEGKFSFSWNKLSGNQNFNNNTLISLRFQALENVFLSRALELNSSITAAEAYTPFAERMDLALVFNDGLGQVAADQLDQNYPNPFHNQTVFPYFLESPGTVQFDIINRQGQIIWQRSKSNAAGQHQLEISSAILPAKGIYQLRMQTGDQTKYRSFIYQ